MPVYVQIYGLMHTPLTLASDKGNKKMVVLLVEAGADVNYRTSDVSMGTCSNRH